MYGLGLAFCSSVWFMFGLLFKSMVLCLAFCSSVWFRFGLLFKYVSSKYALPGSYTCVCKCVCKRVSLSYKCVSRGHVRKYFAGGMYVCEYALPGACCNHVNDHMQSCQSSQSCQ